MTSVSLRLCVFCSLARVFHAEARNSRQSVDHRRLGDAGHLYGGAGHHGGERVAAAHCGQRRRHRGRGHLGPDLLPGGQRHRSADDRLALQPVRAQAHPDDFDRRLHRGFFFLRDGAEPALPDHLPHHPGRHRRRAAAAVAGHHAGSVSAGRPRQGDGLLGTRHRGRAHARPGDWRLDHRQLQLALDFLSQSARRHRGHGHVQAVHLRSPLHRPQDARGLVGHRLPGAGHRRAPGHARQGPGRGLVLLRLHPRADRHDRRRPGVFRHSRTARPATRLWTCVSSRSAPTPPVSSS